MTSRSYETRLPPAVASAPPPPRRASTTGETAATGAPANRSASTTTAALAATAAAVPIVAADVATDVTVAGRRWLDVIAEGARAYWKPLVILLVVAVLVVLVLVYLYYHYSPFAEWWQGISAKDTGNKIVLPRSDAVEIKAYGQEIGGAQEINRRSSNGGGNGDRASNTAPSRRTPYRTPLRATPNLSTTSLSRPNTPPISSGDEEVFNISNNIYTYSDAPAVCKAFNAKLATAKQVEQAYANGADWCSYGWTRNQLALYPTQPKTFRRLQKLPGHEHDCGRVGVNGGYFQNPDLEFGVNCFGKKPEPNINEKALIGYFPDYESAKDRRLQERVAEIKQNKDELMISPFNTKEWDEQRTILERVDDWMEEV